MKHLTDKDVLSGIMFILVGILGASISVAYEFGSTSRPGPGFFPTILSVLLIAIGLVVSAFGIWNLPQQIRPIAFRPFFFITCAVVVFAVCITRFGLAPSVFIAAFTATFSKSDYGIVPRVCAATALVVFSAVLFIVLLQLPIPLWSF